MKHFMKDFILNYLSDLNLFTKKIFSDLFTQLSIYIHTCRCLQVIFFLSVRMSH